MEAELLPLLREKQDAEERRTDPTLLEAALDRIARRWFGKFSDRELRRSVLRIGERTSERQRQSFRRQFTESVGLDPMLLEPWLPGAIDGFVAENVNLIKTVGERFFSDVREQVVGAAREGKRPESLAKDLQERLGVSESNARRIARDQVSKFNADLNRSRQEELGITSYIWRTVNDNRVRSEHRHLNGQVFRWNDPPVISESGERGHPGDAVQCRCYAEPIL